MIYLFHGKDTYRSRKKVREIVRRFNAVAGGGESAYRLILPECSRADVEVITESASLFRDKRLVVLEEPCGAGQDVTQFIESKLGLWAASPDVFVVWEGATQKKSGDILFSIAAHAAKVQEFSRMSGRKLTEFLDEELKGRGIMLTTKEKWDVLAAADGNSWRLVQLLEMCALGAVHNGVPATALPAGEQIVFSFTDACGQRKRTEAWKLLHALIRQGIEPQRMFWALVSHVRALIWTGSLSRSGAPADDLARISRMHPFAAKKAAAQARNFSERELAAIHAQLSTLDFEVKQSRGDIILGLEKIVLSL